MSHVNSNPRPAPELTINSCPLEPQMLSRSEVEIIYNSYNFIVQTFGIHAPRELSDTMRRMINWKVLNSRSTFYTITGPERLLLHIFLCNASTMELKVTAIEFLYNLGLYLKPNEAIESDFKTQLSDEMIKILQTYKSSDLIKNKCLRRSFRPQGYRELIMKHAMLDTAMYDKLLHPSIVIGKTKFMSVLCGMSYAYADAAMNEIFQNFHYLARLDVTSPVVQNFSNLVHSWSKCHSLKHWMFIISRLVNAICIEYNLNKETAPLLMSTIEWNSSFDPYAPLSQSNIFSTNQLLQNDTRKFVGLLFVLVGSMRL